MEFKAGDRVHVTRLNGRDVNIYGILGNAGQFAGKLLDCKNGEFISGIYLPNSSNFGPNKTDYYTLATDEEDTERPVIQRINDMYNDVPTHYKADIDVIEFCRQHFTDEEFKGAMKFNLIKYPTRLGRKDDMVKELDKIIDYAQRYKEVLKQ
ncbi:DUF3310 domain-containing protein [Mammaliicoccus sciuri]|uniref:DUF3310 domain-containing protein n=1 Tax=Mammaliicoccus sciuri TaxID=1296 RepID=UPI00233FF375|nr:DUF3310 domain-containing protein [Mammaliicoccus sciuri]MDC5693332.1 DUF3310 domain-containing protein [Mammaliicoccus sciuri]